MELNYTFDSDTGVLRATLRGHFSLYDAETNFTEILDALVQHQAKKVLINALALTGEPKLMERFYYGQFVADAVMDLMKCGFPSMPYFAYVMAEPILDPHRFGETAAVNRGMFVKAFDNLSEAEHWLKIPPSMLHQEEA